MRKFRDLPLTRKALTLGIVPSICAVLFLAIGSLTATYFRARRNVRTDLQAQADITAINVASSLAFGDRKHAEDTLSSVAQRPSIDFACAYDLDGALFAPAETPQTQCPPTLDAARQRDGTSILRQSAIDFSGGHYGTLIVTGNMSRFYQWGRAQLIATTLALASGILVGLFLTYRIQRAFSAPLLDLARTADAVTATRNYALRARQTTSDEVGGLVQSFNAMLDELQHQNEALTVEIAERKRAEELKDAFLAAVSHELRTPLNAILGRVQILRHTKPTEDRLERSLESLERNARSQARLVEDLLDVSRIVSGKFQLNVDVVDLRTVVNQAVEIAAPQAMSQSISLDVRLAAEPSLVSGDPDRLQQAVLNLLSNALKFSGGNPVSIELKADNPNRSFLITVEDQGIGIASEFLPNVFDRFRQADSSMTRQHGGLGLGLAIVKEVADLHKGSITVASSGLGHGATFTMRLPQLIEVESAAGQAVSPAATAPAVTPLSGVRVLVVDDEPDSLDIAATALATAGASASRASSGQDAVGLWERGGFDALVCDLGMPAMDGFEVLNRVRGLDQRESRRTIAVAVTAYASREYREKSLAAGFQVHLAKPYNTSDLVDAIKDALDIGVEQQAAQNA